jgi:hypothetical protein
MKNLSYIGEKNTQPAFIINRYIDKKIIDLEILCTSKLSKDLISNI